VTRKAVYRRLIDDLLDLFGGSPAPVMSHLVDSGKLSLEDIRALLLLGGPAKASCGEVREIAAHHLEDIRAKLEDLTKLERLLTKTVARCSGKTAPDCPVLEILDIRRPKSTPAI